MRFSDFHFNIHQGPQVYNVIILRHICLYLLTLGRLQHHLDLFLPLICLFVLFSFDKWNSVRFSDFHFNIPPQSHRFIMSLYWDTCAFFDHLWQTSAPSGFRLATHLPFFFWDVKLCWWGLVIFISTFPQGPQVYNVIILRHMCLFLITFSRPQRHLDLGLPPICLFFFFLLRGETLFVRFSDFHFNIPRRATDL